MISKEEYERTYIRMMDSLRDVKGNKKCSGVLCIKCPLHEVCRSEDGSLFQVYKIIEIVEKWGKEHPFVTNADKFKEVFGYEPRSCANSSYACPSAFGKSCHYSFYDNCCDECKKGFWEAEYKEV